MNTTKREKKAKEELLDKCWEYLNDNFHKFNENNKIKIALAINLRSMPTQIEGEISYTRMETIHIEHKTMELNFGKNRASENSRNAFQAPPADNAD